jgi:large repetitive protein
MKNLLFLLLLGTGTAWGQCNPAITISPTNPCSADIVTFSINPISGFTYDWDFTDNGSYDANGSSVTTTYPISTTVSNVTIRLKTTNSATNISVTCTQSITVGSRPIASVGFANNNITQVTSGPYNGVWKICDGTRQFDLSTYNTSTPNCNYTISWGSGSPSNYNSTTFPSNGGQTTVQHTYTNYGYYTLTITATGTGYTCNTTTKTYRLFSGSNPICGVTSPGSTTNLCVPTPITFTIDTAKTNKNPPGTEYIIRACGVVITTLPHPAPPTYTHTFTNSSCGNTSNVSGSVIQDACDFGVEATNPCGVTPSGVGNITLSKPPIPMMTVDSTNNCPDAIYTFNNTSIINQVQTGNPNVCQTSVLANWQVSPNTGWNIVSGALFNSNTLQIEFLTAGTYTVTMTVNSSACGTKTITKTIRINLPAIVAANVSAYTNAGQCVPVTATITNTSTGTGISSNWSVTPPYNYPPTSYNFTGGTTNTSTNPQIQFNQQGTYTVVLTLSGACGNATWSTTIVARGVPSVTLAPPSQQCNNGVLNFAVTNPSLITTTSNGNTLNYNWSFPNGNPNTSTSATPTVNFTGADSYSYTVTVTSAEGCGSSTASATLQVVNNPTYSITGLPAQFCVNSAPVTLTGSPSGGVWSANAPLGVFTPITAGTQTVTYTVSGTCSGSTSTTITVQALPPAAATSATVCAGATATLTASGGDTYIWSTTPTTASLAIPTTAATSTPATYTVTATNTQGCTATATSVLTVTPLPIITMMAASICNTNTNLNLNTAMAVQPLGGMWSPTSVFLTAGGVFNAQAAGTAGSPYTVVYMATVNGCTSSNSAQVTVTSNQPASAGTNQIICKNKTLNLVPLGTPTGGVWSGIGVTNNVFDGAASGVIIGGSGNILTYTIGAGNILCQTSSTMVVTVNDTPIPNLTAANPCIGTTLSLMAAGGGSYTWEGPNGFAPSTANPSITGVTAAAAGVYTVTVTGANTCTNTQSTTIVINPLPTILLTPMTQCQTATLFDLNRSNPTPSGGVWSGQGVSSGHFFDANQAISPPVYAAVYSFTDANGCINSGNTSISITVNNPPSAGIDRIICKNGGLVKMDSIPFGTPIGGVWSGIGITNNVFNPDIAGVGVHSLIYTKGVNECAKSDTMLFTVKALPNLTLTSNSPCAFGTLNFTLNITGAPTAVSYNWAGANSFTSTLQNPTIPNVQSNAIGIYTVTVTGDNTCTNTATNQTIVYGLPNTQSNDTTYCRTVGCYNLPFVSISDPLGTFVWNSFDAAAAVNATATPPCFKPTTSGNGVWNGVVTLTDTHGCIGRDTVKITITEPAILRVSPMIDTVCSSTNVTLHALPAGGKWYRSSVGIPDPSITNDSIVNTATLIGGGLFHYVYSFGEGSCNVKDSVAIFVIALDTISAGANDSFCITKTPFQLIGQTPQNYTPLTAHWENAHVNAAGVYIQNQGITSTGFYTPYTVAGADSSQVIIDTVKFVYTDPVRGCRVVRTKIVTIHPLPVPTNAIPDVGCINTLVSFINNSPNIAQSNWIFYTPQNTVLFTNDSTDVHHVFQDTGVYKVYLEVTSAFGCTASVRDSIHIVAPPYIAFTMSHDTICAGLPVTMTNASGGYQVSYTWDYGDGSVQDSVFAPPPHIFAQAECDTTYIVTLTAYNLCKRLTMKDTILIHPLPVPKWERSDDTICSGQLVRFINHTKGCNTKTYDWSIDGVAWTTDSIPPDTRFTADTLPRTYNICLHATGICGDSTVCHTVFVLPTIISAFINKDKDRGCRPLRVNFTQSSGGPTAPQFTYFWDFGDGTTSTLANPQHVFDSPTRDTFRVLLLVSDGCFADTVSTIVYNFPQPRLAFTHPLYQCAEQGMQFTNTSLDPISSIWIFDDGTRSVATNPTHAFAQAGLHTVTLIGKSLQNGCPDTTTQQVLIRENPLLTPTITPSDGCGPLLVTFTTAGPPPSFDYYYTWNFGDGGSVVDTAHVAIAQTVQHLYAKRDSITRFNVGLTIFDQYQCKSDTLYSPIVLYPTPTADFAYTLDPSCGVNTIATFINFSTSTAGNLRYTWNFGDNTAGSSDDRPTHQYLSSSGKTVTLTAKNTYGCADSIQQRLEYCDGLYIPSAFSPEMGLNEVRLFGAKGIGIKQYRLAVYSRFGNLIWETDELIQGLPVGRWDGTFEGKIVPQDMYIWKCEAVFENGNIWQGQEDLSHKLQRVGTVTVLR